MPQIPGGLIGALSGRRTRSKVGKAWQALIPKLAPGIKPTEPPTPGAPVFNKETRKRRTRKPRYRR